ncbi:hypothetical protein FB451DRAFT_1050655, partial [Mycena latifolia]
SPTSRAMHPPRPDELVLDKRKSKAFSSMSLGELVAPDAEMSVTDARCSARTVLLIRGAYGTYDHVQLVDGGSFKPAEKINAVVEEELDKAGAIILDMVHLPSLFEER